MSEVVRHRDSVTRGLSLVFNFHAVTQQQYRQYIHKYGVCSHKILIPKQEANSQTIVCRPYPTKKHNLWWCYHWHLFKLTILLHNQRIHNPGENAMMQSIPNSQLGPKTCSLLHEILRSAVFSTTIWVHSVKIIAIVSMKISKHSYSLRV